MFAIEAVVAVIGVSVALNKKTAVLAGKVLFIFYEPLLHIKVVIGRGAGIRTRSHSLPKRAC